MDSRKKEAPVIKGHWLWGCGPDLLKDPIRFSAKISLEQGGVVGMRLPDRTVYVSSDAQVASEMLVQSTEKFNRGANYKRLGLLGGEGLITVADGERWKKQRRMAQPGFHKEKVRGFMERFISLSYEVDERWSAKKSEEFKMSDEMSRFTLKAVSETLFSRDVATDFPEFPGTLKELLRFVNLRHYERVRWPINWPIPRYTDFRRKRKHLDDIVYQMIGERESKPASGDDLLGMFLDAVDAETGETMDTRQIRDELFTVLVAGFETSSVALTWVWYVLNEYPEIATRMREEHERVIGSGPVVPEHLPQLIYTQQIIQETMRLYPPVFALPRGINADCEVGGLNVKGPNPMLISIYGLHRNPLYWENPTEFNPDNFSPEKKEKRHRHAYIPFGSGQRICIGSQFAMLEMTALLAVLGRKYHPVPRKEYVPELIAAITTNVSEGMPMIMNQLRN